VPDLDVKASRVEQTRVVAVRATPAEARPGELVNWEAIVVSPLRDVSAARIDWALCSSPRNPADSITVGSACFGAADPNAGPMAVVTPLVGMQGQRAQATIPSDACRKIGPEVPQKSDTGSAQRSPDADITGGYQLPVRLVLTDTTGQDVSFDRQRVRCNLASAPAAAAREYEERYKPNQNPVIVALEFTGLPTAVDGSARFGVQRGSRITIRVQWAVEAKETYVLFDPIAREVRERSENLEVGWFTNGGEFDRDRTTADGDFPVSSNQMVLDPDFTEPATVWVVLRDDRGGVGTTRLTIDPL
jgi:hypothetical protein